MIFIYCIIVGLPALLVFFSVKKIIKAGKIKQQGIKAHGIITQVTFVHFSKGSFDKIQVAYKDDKGIYHTANASTTPGQYKPGDTMPVTYRKDKPAEYTMDGMPQGQWALLIFSALLLAFTIFASFKINELVEAGNYSFHPFSLLV
ncbi:MAG: hypothetical protein QM791_15350 [Ferruginibacter sp.]